MIFLGVFLAGVVVGALGLLAIAHLWVLTEDREETYYRDARNDAQSRRDSRAN